ncbi:MAG: S8 family serine peptidase [Deltaproteobacteria bacterium]|nr:S8 family serine peptidase [Deltaproteobacteria bacterium]
MIAPRGDAAAVTAAVAEVGGSIAWTSPRSGLVLVRFATAHDAQAARQVLAHDARIASAWPNRMMRGAGIATSPRALQAWAVHAMHLPTSAPDQTGVVVALLDSGVAYEDYDDGALTYARASDLALTPFADGWDFVNDDAHPNDDHGHGTQLADLIAGTGEIAAPGAGATIMPIKVLDQNNEGTELALAEGIRYAVDHGAAVINMSLSFPVGYFPSAYLQNAIDYADAAGVVMVAAAGNQGTDGVTYPAAFREVIAVGAAKLAPEYRSPKTDPWQYAESYLQRAAYSNLGDKVEIVAPSGDFDGDADNNGLPEGSVAQSPVAGNPSQFEYVIGAGTSQASALVAGTAAAMLGQNRGLTPHQIRSLLGEGARAQVGGATLSPAVGRGYLDVATAVEAAAREEVDARPRFAVGLRVAMVDAGTARAARATVEVIDADGQPAAGMVVYGGFSGSASDRATGITDASGVVSFDAPVGGDAAVVAFEVDAVANALFEPTVFERPRGAVFIDSCSLELMSTYASGAGIATSPQGATSGSGIATSPVNATGDVDAGTDDGIATSPISGQGIATSPITTGEGIATSPHSSNGIATSPTTGQGIATSPIALRGPLLAGERASYTLLNYSWRGATVPMAVAVDAAWFDTAFPDASIVTSEGAGIATSPIRLNPATAFKVAVAPVAADATACQPLIVRTFLAGLDATPVQPTGCGDLAGCTATRAELAEIADWAASGQGIATSPVWTPARTMPQAQFAQALTALTAWTAFANQGASSPPAALGDVLEAAAIGASAPAGAATSCPMSVPADDDPLADSDAGFDVGSPAPIH